MTKVLVSSGDTLYFVIDPNVDYFCDSTGFDVTITPVPPITVPEAPVQFSFRSWGLRPAPWSWPTSFAAAVGTPRPEPD
jgi:hypothetical protein